MGSSSSRPESAAVGARAKPTPPPAPLALSSNAAYDASSDVSVRSLRPTKISPATTMAKQTPTCCAAFVWR